MADRAPFFVENADLPGLQHLVSRLADIGYRETTVRERLGLDDLADLQWRAVPVYRLTQLASRDPLALAIDLFLLQGTLSAEELDRLLVPSERDGLIRSGLLATDSTGASVARASLYPVGDRLIFSDHAWPELPHPGLVPVPYDQVMGIGLDSRHLSRCTVRRPFRSALDLCTGSGIHALLAAAHSEQVRAVDINPRAARCTQFNTQLSGIANLEACTGDLYQPVGADRFDLITANPPFVPSPLNTLGFRDGGKSGEDIQKRLFAGLPDHLAPGGIAQVVTELGERTGQSLMERLRTWLNGAPLDIHILQLGGHSAMKYATGHAKGDDFGSYLESVHDWAANLQEQGYGSVVSVVISMQWSSGRPWERVDQSSPPRRDAGSEIDAIFAAERLVRHPEFEAAIRRSSVCRLGSVALLDAQLFGVGSTKSAKATLLGQALTIEHALSPLEREILAGMDGRTPVVDEPLFIAAIRSLLQHRLVFITY